VAERTTGVKVNLDDSGFKAGARRLVADATTAGRGMGKGLSDGLASGFERSKQALVAGASSVRQSLGPLMQVGGIGGAIGLAAFANDATKTQGALTRVARELRQAGGEAYSYARLQSEAKKVTDQWGYSAQQLGGAIDSVFKETGDPALAVGSMNAIAMATRDTGAEMGTLSTVAGSVAEQFGVDAAGMGDALAIVVGASRQGGASIDDLAGGMGDLGRAAKLAGVEGVDGLKKTLALVNTLEDSAGGGSQAIGLLTKTFAALEASPAKRKELKALGIDTSGNGLDVLQRLMKKTGGDQEKLGKFFRPEQAAVLSQGLGGGKLEEALKRASETAMSEADLRKNAAEQMQTSEAKIEAALNRMRDKFAEPKFLAAIDKFADAIPKLADVAVKAADFAVDNPMLTGAGIAAHQLGGFAGALASAGKAAGEAASSCGCGGGGGAGGGAGKGGGAAGGGVGLGVATTAAVLAVGAAADQASKLADELAAGKTGSEIAGNDEDLLRSAVASGVEDAVVTGDGRILMPDTGGNIDMGTGTSAGWNHLNDTGTGGMIDLTPAGGWAEGEKEAAMATSKFNVGAWQRQTRAGKMGIGSFLESEGIADSASMLRPGLSKLPDRGAASGTAPAAKANGESARLLAEMLASNQNLSRTVQGGLAVDIRNIDQVASALKAGGPGYGPRE
jgi:TP901 family phage tail tape measure protein